MVRSFAASTSSSSRAWPLITRWLTSAKRSSFRSERPKKSAMSFQEAPPPAWFTIYPSLHGITLPNMVPAGRRRPWTPPVQL